MKGMQPLTDEEISLVSKSFSGAYSARDKALFVLGVTSGFRVSELLSLQVRDVSQGDRVTVQRRNMKRKIEGRTVRFHPQAKAAVAAWLLEVNLQPTDFVFQSRQGGAMTRQQAGNVLRAAYEANSIGRGHGCHAMRKSYAGMVYKHFNHDLVKTQKALGHKNVNSTVSYLSFAEEELDEAVLAIAI